MARDKQTKRDENELNNILNGIQQGIQAGEELKHDKSTYHTLDEIPEPLGEKPKFRLPKSKKVKVPKEKRQYSEKQLAQFERIKKMKAPNWKPGQSGNPAGRPKGSGSKVRDPLKTIGMQLAYTNATLTLTAKQKKLAKSLGYAPGDIKLIEALMIHLATSANPNKIALFLERTFGKVPSISLHAQYNEDLVKRFHSKLTDSELEQVADGADVLEILLSKLPDADETDNTQHNTQYIEGEEVIHNPMRRKNISASEDE